MDFTHVAIKRMGSFDRSPILPGVGYSKMATPRYAGSAHGGAGGYGTKISTGSGFGLGGYSNLQINTNSDVLLSGNEKETMQNLNIRLETYLDKVKSLEKANSVFETQIKEWHIKHSGVVERDYSNYFKTLEGLKNQILSATLDNARILLQIDNAKLAAGDFRLKFETEQALRFGVEKDISGLRKVIDDLCLTRADLELQIENLQEEMGYLKRNHEEEVTALRKKVGGTVNVEMDAAPSVDLSQVLNDMRLQCETVCEKIREDARKQFDSQIEVVSHVIETNTSELEQHKSTITEMHRSVQGLEIELQAEQSKRDALAAALDNVNAQYSARLAQIQGLISNREAQLVKIRSDMGRQAHEYEILLNIKIRLEMEIATYRRLLEGEETSLSLEEDEKLRELNRSRIIKTIVEEMIDGKVVATEVKSIEEKLPSIMQK